MKQTVGMMDALGIARHLRADDAGRVAVALRPMHPPDAAPVNDLHIQRAGRGAVMRADGGAMLDAGCLIHGGRMMRESGGKEKAARGGLRTGVIPIGRKALTGPD